MIDIKELKILQLGKFYPIKGGVEKVMLDLTQGISERGIRCDMLCAASHRGSQTIRLNDHGSIHAVRTLKKAAATMLSPAMIGTLRRIARDYDIIHVHHPDPMACLALLLSGFRGKVVLHWHADILRQRLLLKFYAPLQKRLTERADLIICTTPDYLYSSPWLRSHIHKGTTLPIGIEPVREADAASVEAIRSRWPGKKIVFSLGRLVPYKGYRYLIEAAGLLPDDYVVAIGGNGPLKEELQQQIDAAGVSGKAVLLGGLPEAELPTWYHAADIFCLPSVQKTEAFGIVQIEAMSCGKPVVATRIPGSGTGWVNEHGFSGLNTDIEDARGLAEAITEITSTPETYARFSAGARQRFEKFFTLENMIEKCLSYYSQL